MDEEYFRKLMSRAIIIVLLILTFFLIKPILISILAGLFLAFIFLPIYKWILKRVKLKDIASSIVCLLFVIIIITPIWFFTPIAIEQSFKFYQASQQIDYITPLKKILPSLFASEQFSAEVGSIIRSFISKTISSFMTSLSKFILNFPELCLQFFVVLFTFYFSLRDNEKLMNYVKSLLPFSKEVEKKLFESSRAITIAVIYGQIIIGLIQGVIVGAGLLIFSVPNVILLTLLACIAGVFPIVGTALVWIPIVIYLLLAGNTFAAVGIVIFGIISSSVDNILRPLFVSKRTKFPSSLVLIGMIGGIFLFGILGLIIGPLIIAYLIIVIDIYRNKSSSFLVKN